MFIGHWAPAIAASTHPKAPKLWVLFIAAQFVDFAFFAFVLLGVEHLRIEPGITRMVPFDLYDMPLTHSLLGTLGWAVLFAALVWMFLKNRMAAFLAGAVVLSHWLLDLLVHRPDLTLFGSPPLLGLGLWNHPWIAIPLELGITAATLMLFLRRSQGKLIPFLVLSIVLLIMQMINWFGPPPEELSAELPVTALIAYTLAVVLAWWLGTSRKITAYRG